MKAVIQRVKSAHVVVDAHIVGQIEKGLLVLLGICHKDTLSDCKWLVEKIANLRIFSDSQGKMNLSVKELKLQVLVVSQFTLYGNCRGGRRPDFIDAALPTVAEPLYLEFVRLMQETLGIPVPTGSFGDHMEVHLVGDGPVTLVLG